MEKLKKLKCLECNKIIKDNYSFIEFEKDRYTFTYRCSCGDQWQMVCSIPPGPKGIDLREYQQFKLWKNNIKKNPFKEYKHERNLKLKTDIIEKTLENNINMDLTRYNELIEKLDTKDIFNDDTIEIKYELNKLHGILFGKDINESVMDYVPDSSEIEKGTYINWKEYWENRKKKDQYIEQEQEPNERTIFGNKITKDEIIKKLNDINNKYKK